MIPMLFLAFALFSYAKPDAQPPPIVRLEPGPLSGQMLMEVNALRERGCRCGSRWMPPVPPLSWNNQLARAALRHANDMNKNNFFDHRGSDGSAMSERISDTGYAWRAVAENIAWGHPDVAAVVQGWKNSPGHCENMMSGEYKEIGAARAGGYWVQDLGRR
ncbi:MAG: CAP domain-containing protein [Phaeodactylibacter sp.]|nr:CAP domain-containing protein [Phaeodactylibacter sp.]MCB9049781.1 CAP domain-containing protein [Lewinellaceae bacterium]